MNGMEGYISEVIYLSIPTFVYLYSSAFINLLINVFVCSNFNCTWNKEYLYIRTPINEAEATIAMMTIRLQKTTISDVAEKKTK